MLPHHAQRVKLSCGICRGLDRRVQQATPPGQWPEISTKPSEPSMVAHAVQLLGARAPAQLTAVRLLG